MDILYLIGALILGAGLGIGTAFFVAERECFHNINEIPLAPLYSEPSLDEEVHKLEKK